MLTETPAAASAMFTPPPPHTHTDLPAMGRFTLRDEGRTIAIGKVTKLPKIH